MTTDVDTAAEPTIKVRQVAIFIPGKTSFVKIAPKYVLALYRAKWKDKLSDPAHQVQIIPPPVEFTDADMWRELPEINACEYEAMRLRREFGQHVSGEPLFDVVYPAGTFETAFNDALTNSKAPVIGASLQHPATALLTAIAGVGPLGAKKLIEAGIDSIFKLAHVDPIEVSRLLGKARAVKAQEAAVAALPKPEEGSEDASTVN